MGVEKRNDLLDLKIRSNTKSTLLNEENTVSTFKEKFRCISKDLIQIALLRKQTMVMLKSKVILAI